ncbi:MAG TPA: glycosyltransferase family 39 protein, partial [Kineosporiaceae bacterium]|nr:glycosyltransferase family 39 protein [Kineosporiaceae bacterium]
MVDVAGVAPARETGGRALPRGAWVVAGLAVALLAAFGGGYGYHRDELYFLEAGRHPAFGYPDQPPLVPLLAVAADVLGGGHLWVFRLVPALLVGATVVLGALTSRELGGARRDRVWTAAAVALCSTVLGAGHLFSTTTFDLALTAACVLLLVRAVAAPERLGRWVALGVVAAVALEVKTLPATVLACCGVGILVAGPRRVLLRPGLWLAAAIAAVGALPNLWWQAAHGWPQLELARAIASGSSGTSVGRALVVPLQLLLTGPVPAVPFVAGLVALLSAAWARPWRWIAVGYLAMLLFVVVTGGKPYYLLGFVPALIAAGVPGVRAWVERGRLRRWVTGVLVGVQLVVSAVVALPVVPVGSLASTPIVDINYDAGETVGWDAFTATVEQAAARVPATARSDLVVVTGNYGEAGALDRARRRGADLPPVYSGHNGYGLWGPPRGVTNPVILVGWESDADA